MNFIIDSPNVGSKIRTSQTARLKLSLREDVKSFKEETQPSPTPWIFGSACKLSCASEVVITTPHVPRSIVLDENSGQALKSRVSTSGQNYPKSLQTPLKTTHLRIPTLSTNQRLAGIQGSESNLSLGIHRIKKFDFSGLKVQPAKQGQSSSILPTDQTLPLGPGFINNPFPQPAFSKAIPESSSKKTLVSNHGFPTCTTAAHLKRSHSQKPLVTKPILWKPAQKLGDSPADSPEEDNRTWTKKTSIRVDPVIPAVVTQGWEMYAPYMTPSSNLSSHYLQPQMGFGQMANLRTAPAYTAAAPKPTLNRAQSNWETDRLKPRLAKLSRNFSVEQVQDLLKNRLGDPQNLEEKKIQEVFGSLEDVHYNPEIMPVPESDELAIKTDKNLLTRNRSGSIFGPASSSKKSSMFRLDTNVDLEKLICEDEKIMNIIQNNPDSKNFIKPLFLNSPNMKNKASSPVESTGTATTRRSRNFTILTRLSKTPQIVCASTGETS